MWTGCPFFALLIRLVTGVYLMVWSASSPRDNDGLMLLLFELPADEPPCP